MQERNEFQSLQEFYTKFVTWHSTSNLTFTPIILVLFSCFNWKLFQTDILLVCTDKILWKDDLLHADASLFLLHSKSTFKYLKQGNWQTLLEKQDKKK